MKLALSRICFVGHCTIDDVYVDGEAWRSIGGTVVYASLAAKLMGADVTVVTRIGRDFPPELEAQARNLGLDLLPFKIGKSTTHFVLRYKGEARELRSVSRGDDIEPVDVVSEADAFHLGPVAGEIAIEVAKRVRESCDLVSLDVQGLVRDFEEGRVVERKRVPASFFELVNIAKGSATELRAATGIQGLRKALKNIHKLGPTIVMATIGMQGTLALVEGRLYRIPAFEVADVADCTGAGDALMGAFMAEYARGQDPIWSIAVGSAVASALVETRGPSVKRARSDIYERAERVLDEVELVSTS